MQMLTLANHSGLEGGCVSVKEELGVEDKELVKNMFRSVTGVEEV